MPRPIVNDLCSKFESDSASSPSRPNSDLENSKPLVAAGSENSGGESSLQSSMTNLSLALSPASSFSKPPVPAKPAALVLPKGIGTIDNEGTGKAPAPSPLNVSTKPPLIPARPGIDLGGVKRRMSKKNPERTTGFSVCVSSDTPLPSQPLKKCATVDSHGFDSDIDDAMRRALPFQDHLNRTMCFNKPSNSSIHQVPQSANDLSKSMEFFSSTGDSLSPVSNKAKYRSVASRSISGGSASDSNRVESLFVPSALADSKKKLKSASTNSVNTIGNTPEDNEDWKPNLRAVHERKPIPPKESELPEPEFDRLFDFVAVVSLQNDSQETSTLVPRVTYRFPPVVRDTDDSEQNRSLLSSIPQFCFPDLDAWQSPVTSYQSETFSFILTDIDGSKRFGYCRRLLPSGTTARLPEVFCVISPVGCFEIFSTLLDIVEQRRATSSSAVFSFLKSVIANPFPRVGETVKIKAFSQTGDQMDDYALVRPVDSSHYEHVDFGVFFKALGINKAIRVFWALTLERHVIFSARNLSVLSKCVFAAVACLYPFDWENVYIPVLPSSLLDFCCSPTPFVIGILSSCLDSLQDLPIDDVLIVNLDTGNFSGNIDNGSCPPLPSFLESNLRNTLEKLLDGPINSRAVGEAFMRVFVDLIGTYRRFLKKRQSVNEVLSHFDYDGFVSRSPKSTRKFVRAFSLTQMFSVFIQKRESASVVSDAVFEHRLALIEDFDGLCYDDSDDDRDRSFSDKIKSSAVSGWSFLKKKTRKTKASKNTD